MQSHKPLFSPTLIRSETKTLEEYSNSEVHIAKNIQLYIFYLQYNTFQWEIVKTHENFIELHKQLKENQIKPIFTNKTSFLNLNPIEKITSLEKYLIQIFSDPETCQKSTLKTFLDVSETSFEGTVIKRKEGFIKKRTGGRKGNEKKFFNCNKCTKRFQRRYMIIRDTGIYISKNNEKSQISEVLMYDNKFQIKFSKETGYEDGIVIDTNRRVLVIRTGSVLKLVEWKKAIEQALRESEYSDKNKRFESLYPVRENNNVKLFVDGEDYFNEVYKKLKKAKSQVFITDWWLSPEMYLKRPAKKYLKSQLIDILDKLSDKGVSVYVHVYKELASALTLNSKYTVQTLRKKNPKIRAIRHPKRSLYGGEFLWSHHEKIICVDQEIAFLGGLDICYGRMDTQKHKLKDISEKPYWNGIDYSNSRIQDFDNVSDWKTDRLDRKTQPRMPWHDVGVMVKGGAAYDVSVNYIELWNHVMTDFSGGYFKNKYLLTPLKPTQKLEVPIIPEQKNPVYLEESDSLSEKRVSIEDYKIFNKKKSLTIDEEIKEQQYAISGSIIRLGKEGTCSCQIVRSAGTWSYGLDVIDQSAQNAYLELIEKANYYIYIENQFFISSTAGDIVQNLVAKKLAEKIISKAAKNEPFKVIVVLPLLPGFAGEIDAGSSSVLRIQLYWEYQTIIRGDNSLFNLLRRSDFIKDPNEYIKFYSLRTHDQFGENGVTEIVYIHSKVMIIDDDEMIIGSANINDRSLVGDRDSEIAMVISDTKKIKSRLAGQLVEVSKIVYDFRIKIFKEFLGECREEDITDPLSGQFSKEWEGTAYSNTQKYREVFGCYPDDTMTTYEELKKVKSEANLKLYSRIKKEFKGFLVEFPLNFLSKVDLNFSILNVENLLPSKSFT
jgi:phospholipase D1/2